MANQVAPPGRQLWRYGLSSVAEVSDHELFRLVSDYTFDSVACNTGIIWEPACGPEFTVTFTKSATADTFNVAVSPGVVGDYEVNVNNGGFVALTSTVVSTDAAPTPVVVRETTGLKRAVSNANVNFDSATGTQYVFQSEQTNNDPKTFVEGIGAPSASPFVVIGGAACTPMADYDWDALGREALGTVEWPKVEERFWNVQLATATPELPVGSTAQTLVNAVAVLEEYARGITGYEPTLHASSFLGAHAAAQGVVTDLADGLTKYTALHTPVAFGGGYPRTGPDGDAATATQAWMFLTGKVAVHRGPVMVPGSEGERFTQSNNQLFIMAERPYAVIPDCPLAAVLVETEPA